MLESLDRKIVSVSSLGELGQVHATFADGTSEIGVLDGDGHFVLSPILSEEVAYLTPDAIAQDAQDLAREERGVEQLIDLFARRHLDFFSGLGSVKFPVSLRWAIDTAFRERRFSRFADKIPANGRKKSLSYPAVEVIDDFGREIELRFGHLKGSEEDGWTITNVHGDMPVSVNTYFTID